MGFRSASLSALFMIAVLSVFAMCALVAVSAPALSAPPTTKSADWPQSGHDASHAGFNSNEAVINSGNVSALEKAWSFSIGSGNEAGNVVESDGLVYAATSSGMLYALASDTGALAWSYDTSDGFSTSGSSPAADGGLVFSVCAVVGGSQGVCALNALTGTLSWGYSLPGSGTYIATPPAVAMGRVFFAACGTSCVYVSLNENTGKLIWNAPVVGGCSPNGGAPLAVSGRVLFAGEGCSNTAAVALSADFGSKLWSRNLGTGSPKGISVSGNSVGIELNAEINSQSTTTGLIIAANDGTLEMVDPATTNPNNWGAPSFAYKNVYFLIGDGLASNRVKVSRKGHIKRVFYAANGAASAAVANGVVYILGSGIVSAVSATTGANLWSSGIASTVGFPIIANGVVYGACGESSICAWSLPQRVRYSGRLPRPTAMPRRTR